MKGGRETGMTAVGHNDFGLADDWARMMHGGNYTFKSKAVVQQPRNIIIAENIFAQGYLGGNGVSFKDASTRPSTRTKNMSSRPQLIGPRHKIHIEYQFFNSQPPDLHSVQVYGDTSFEPSVNTGELRLGTTVVWAQSTNPYVDTGFYVILAQTKSGNLRARGLKEHPLTDQESTYSDEPYIPGGMEYHPKYFDGKCFSQRQGMWGCHVHTVYFAGYVDTPLGDRAKIDRSVRRRLF